MRLFLLLILLPTIILAQSYSPNEIPFSQANGSGKLIGKKLPSDKSDYLQQGLGFSSYTETLITGTDAAQVRGTLGLGTLATQNGVFSGTLSVTGVGQFSGTSSGLNTGDQDLSGYATISGTNVWTGSNIFNNGARFGSPTSAGALSIFNSGSTSTITFTGTAANGSIVIRPKGTGYASLTSSNLQGGFFAGSSDVGAYDPNGSTSAYFHSRQLISSDGFTAMLNWGSGTLISGWRAMGTFTVTGTHRIGATDSAGALSIFNTGTTTFIEASGTAANGNITISPKGLGGVDIVPSSQMGGVFVADSYITINDTGSGMDSASFNNRVLYDFSGVESVSWGDRYLKDSAGDVSVDWGTQELHGNWTGSGNITVSGTTSASTFQITSGTASPPSNTATPAAWAEIIVSGTSYRFGLFQ